MELAFVSTTSYASAALVNTVLLLLLLTSWRGRLQGGLLIAAVLLTILATAASALQSYSEAVGLTGIITLESIKQGAWALFLLRLLVIRTDISNPSGSALRRYLIPGIVILYSLAAVFSLSSLTAPSSPRQLPSLTPLLIGAIFIIWVVEQLFRNSDASERWAIKYLCIGIGGAISFDVILFIDALLFHQINPGTWAARGFVQAIAVPLIAISATRNPDWEVKVFVSRSVVYFSSSLIAIGVYLILVAIAGYYLKTFGGDWGETLQVTLIFAALLSLLVIVSSVQLRGQIKQFIARHFYRNKYEYRDEWLQLTQRLSDPAITSPHQEALSAIRDLLNSPRGALWSKDSTGRWRQTCRWEWPDSNAAFVIEDALLDQLQQQANIIDLTRAGNGTERAELPAALSSGHQPWLLIPLVNQGTLVALIQLGESHAQSRQLDWEDIALVSAAAYQVAAYLAFHDAINKLAEARQFEAYNQLSAFLVHDLKNVVAQLQLVVKNADKHADNPEFIKDAFTTVNNAVDKMNTMLSQLRDRHAATNGHTIVEIDLSNILQEVVTRRSGYLPVPKIDLDETTRLTVKCDQEKMLNVLLHLVANAQEATDNEGRITIRGTSNSAECRLEIEDNGCGISDEFVKRHLFRPFKTTKGNAGMGIGVYESKEYIESVGGSISVTSQVGEGTLFSILLPRTTTDCSLRNS
ncbi:MAG: PEP-CTERM system histidine kinase PrsK [Immundisolibacteraceae bacterium]|nr:PEP-CTERM system histidine kinase PrsK [Immundisolibacteraceae bacterium]